VDIRQIRPVFRPRSEGIRVKQCSVRLNEK
jgi:hypothetical protein